MEKTGSLRSWGLLRTRYFSTLEGKLPYAIQPCPRLLPAPEANQPGQQRRGLLTRLPRAGQPGNDNAVSPGRTERLLRCRRPRLSTIHRLTDWKARPSIAYRPSRRLSFASVAYPTVCGLPSAVHIRLFVPHSLTVLLTGVGCFCLTGFPNVLRSLERMCSESLLHEILI
jgi:hypothetical protein